MRGRLRIGLRWRRWINELVISLPRVERASRQRSVHSSVGLMEAQADEGRPTGAATGV